MSGNRRRLSFYSDPRVLVPLWVIVIAGAVWFGAGPIATLMETGVTENWTRGIGAEWLSVDPLSISIAVGSVVAIGGLVVAWALTRGERRPARVSTTRQLVELDPIRRRS